MKKLVAVLALITFNVHAAPDCRELPSCESLGYICSAEECGDLKALSCPFDLSKKVCFPKEKDCQLGDVLYDDLKCHDAPCGKTPIAVVFDTEKRLAVALNKYPSLQWSSDLVDLPDLENCPFIARPDNATCEADISGKINTAKIVNYGKENDITFAAAEYCYNLTFGGLSQGTWWLPNYIEALSLSRDNYIAIKQTFIKHGITFFDGMSLTWTSTEYNAENAFMIQLSDGTTNLTPSFYSKKVERSLSTLCVVGY